MVELSTSYWNQALTGSAAAQIDRSPGPKNLNQAIKQSSCPSHLPVCPSARLPLELWEEGRG
jgi:hypothetical protein